jgi:hypothetical protein
METIYADFSVLFRVTNIRVPVIKWKTKNITQSEQFQKPWKHMQFLYL